MFKFNNSIVPNKVSIGWHFSSNKYAYRDAYSALKSISPKHDVYAPREKLRKCSQHSDLQHFPHRQAKPACTIVAFDF